MRSCRVVRIYFTWDLVSLVGEACVSTILFTARQDVVWTGRTSVALLADEDRAVWSRFSRGHR